MVKARLRRKEPIKLSSVIDFGGLRDIRYVLLCIGSMLHGFGRGYLLYFTFDIPDSGVSAQSTTLSSTDSCFRKSRGIREMYPHTLSLLRTLARSLVELSRALRPTGLARKFRFCLQVHLHGI